MCECKSIFQRLKLSPNEQLETYVCEHNIVNVEVEDTDHNNDNDDDSDENEGDDLDEITFPDAGVFDGTSTSVVVPAAAVVTEASVPTLTGGSIEGGHGGSGTVTGGDGAGIGYFSGVGRGAFLLLNCCLASHIFCWLHHLFLLKSGSFFSLWCSGCRLII